MGLILLILVVLVLLAALHVQLPGPASRVDLAWLGMAFYLAAMLM